MALYALPSPGVAATTVIADAIAPSMVRDLPAEDMVETTSSGQAMFEEALVRHLDALHRLARRLTGQVHDAEDLVQETVARALARRTQFHPGSNLGAWLCTIMRSLYITAYRRERRAPLLRSMDALEDEGVLYDTAGRCSSASAEHTALHGWMDDAVTAALQNLPAQFRRAVLLCDVDELSYAEAAQAMGCPVGTVMSRLHRGRSLLRAALSGQYATPRALESRPALPRAA